jgi:hypothetical protein
MKHIVMIHTITLVEKTKEQWKLIHAVFVLVTKLRDDLFHRVSARERFDLFMRTVWKNGERRRPTQHRIGNATSASTSILSDERL